MLMQLESDNFLLPLRYARYDSDESCWFSINIEQGSQIGLFD